ncbi:hypothetical protein CEUSTIGMA_g7311.t1 [Chlamydomonas eustigma]|uniref:G10 protein n=1 Tax=Chlamydomonas eustigma TaxID=1157962 RepID=A0A250X9V2_9CHLO|nr:hypothetical protein CEUSTIGMA_g7311.t1 [Chlamydomonas eustigma]|eukprot:GAX79871.1 hypothetical protein CEUSTIGMA_g7311.t1 [Chlamydomonas eustigma]
MSSIRRKLKGKKPPEGWELIEEVIEDFETQMKEAVNEEHEGKRKAELSWKIHRLHWEKNRFIYDLMYQRKVMSKELFEYLTREKIADGSLISKWRKPGYEILCSMLAIQKGNHNFGTTSHCRVPMKQRSSQQRITPDVQNGCISCASGDGRFGGPIWWNTPLEDDGTTQDENRTTWQQQRAAEEEAAGPSSRKRGFVDDFTADGDDEMPEAVRQRLEALKKGAKSLD